MNRGPRFQMHEHERRMFWGSVRFVLCLIFGGAVALVVLAAACLLFL
jgi:hypothetical protein